VITDETYSQLIGEVDEALMDKSPSVRLVEQKVESSKDF